MTSIDILFSYEGHQIALSPQTVKGELQWYFIVDGYPITFVSNPDTAKRLAIKFIDVVTDAHHGKSRQNPLYPKTTV